MCWSSCAVGRPASALVTSRSHRQLSPGTDGYPLKPFNLCELSVRIEAVLRRETCECATQTAPTPVGESSESSGQGDRAELVMLLLPLEFATAPDAGERQLPATPGQRHAELGVADPFAAVHRVAVLERVAV